MIPLSKPLIGRDEREAVDRVLRSGHLAGGTEVEQFEAEFGDAHHVPFAVAVSNGTAALHLGLWAMGVGPGDEVVVPSFTFAATVNAVRMLGARVAFADIDPVSYCLSSRTVEAVMNHRTVAVVQVHLYGQPTAMDELTTLCNRHGVALIEDAAQAHGAQWDGVPVGGQGVFGAFSFYPTKNMTTGEGGMITTTDSDLAHKARLLRNHGMEHRYQHEIVGTNARMTDLAAAIGRVQLAKLPEWNGKRSVHAAFYDARLEGVGKPVVASLATHVYHQYTIRCSNRQKLIGVLDERQIGYGIYYDPPCHLQKAFGGGGGPFPETERAAKEVISIPIRQNLSGEELTFIAETVNSGARR